MSKLVYLVFHLFDVFLFFCLILFLVDATFSTCFEESIKVAILSLQFLGVHENNGVADIIHEVL